MSLDHEASCRVVAWGTRRRTRGREQGQTGQRARRGRSAPGPGWEGRGVRAGPLQADSGLSPTCRRVSPIPLASYPQYTQSFCPLSVCVPRDAVPVWRHKGEPEKRGRSGLLFHTQLLLGELSGGRPAGLSVLGRSCKGRPSPQFKCRFPVPRPRGSQAKRSISPSASMGLLVLEIPPHLNNKLQLGFIFQVFGSFHHVSMGIIFLSPPFHAIHI